MSEEASSREYTAGATHRPGGESGVPDAGQGGFAYSFDRELWRGSYATRASALQAARKALATYPATPEAIWVGRRVEAPLPIDGHARAVLEQMRRRLDSAKDRRIDLERVPENELSDLDDAIGRVLLDWLRRQERLHQPAGIRRGTATVEAVSEHPLPLVHHTPQPQSREVHILGNEG